MFIIISCSALFGMRNVPDKSSRETRNTNFMFHYFFFSENRDVYEMWKNIVERGMPQTTIWRMRIECCIPKATNTHTGCVMVIAFPLQQWLLHERCSMLRYTYIACLVSPVTSTAQLRPRWSHC